MPEKVSFSLLVMMLPSILIQTGSIVVTQWWYFSYTISLSCHEQVCLSGLRFERYFSHHREKYLSKHSPLKHTCSWHDKLIVLWILNRQAKISLRIWYFSPLAFKWFSPNHLKGFFVQSNNLRIIFNSVSYVQDVLSSA